MDELAIADTVLIEAEIKTCMAGGMERILQALNESAS